MNENYAPGINIFADSFLASLNLVVKSRGFKINDCECLCNATLINNNVRRGGILLLPILTVPLKYIRKFQDSLDDQWRKGTNHLHDFKLSLQCK